jgi:predicted nuclease of predicted toxin-antitoxin system
MTLNYHARVARDPRIAGGEATIKGTRVTLRTVRQPGGRRDDGRDPQGLPDALQRGRPGGHRIRCGVGPGRSASRRGARGVRIKLDENLPTGLVQLLTGLGHDVDTVPDEGVAGQDYTVVWRAAQDAGRFLSTQDLDFSDARTFASGTHHGILLVRLPQPGRAALSERVATLFRGEEVESWAGCMVTRHCGRCA